MTSARTGEVLHECVVSVRKVTHVPAAVEALLVDLLHDRRVRQLARLDSLRASVGPQPELPLRDPRWEHLGAGPDRSGHGKVGDGGGWKLERTNRSIAQEGGRKRRHESFPLMVVALSGNNSVV